MLGVLVLCIAMVSCNSNPIESQEEVEVSFAPTVSKALNESAEKQDDNSMKVEDYYWDYWCDTTTPDKSGIDFKEFAFKTSGTDTYVSDKEAHEMKGLGIIKGLTKGNMYYFGLKGYADAERTKLMWEGYTRVDDTDKSAYRAVRITKTTYVQIHVFSKGSGSLVYDIKAPFDDDSTTTGSDSTVGYNGENNDTNRFNNYKSTYFFVSYYKIESDGSIKTSGTDRFDTEDEGFMTVEDNKSTNTNGYYRGISYNSVKNPVQLDAGTYFFTISQNKTGDETVVPGRKQVLIVNIAPGAVTKISGDLNSTIGVSVDWDASKYMIVIFHNTYDGSIKTLEVTNRGELNPMTTESNFIDTSATNQEYVFEPSVDGKQVTWYINGVALDQSVLASKTSATSTGGHETYWDYGDADKYFTSWTSMLDDGSADDYRVYANEYGSYAWVDNFFNIHFVRGNKKDKDDALTTSPSDLGMEDFNQYLFTAILDETETTAQSFSFTVGTTAHPVATT